MKEERMQVLNMLGEGKISAAEAERLLDLLTKPNKSDRKERMADFTAEFSDKAVAFNDKVEALVKDFAEKMETVAKDVEPKLKKATQIIIERTVATVDELSKTFHEEVKAEPEVEPAEQSEDEPKEN
jgi:hypothetical protein